MDQTSGVERSESGEFERTLESEKAIPSDVILSAVVHRHRRAVLRSLTIADEEVLQVSELVDQVTDRVRSEDAPEGDRRRRVHTALLHTHLPKLHDAGLIIYDTETKQVRDSTGELSTELLSVIAPFDAPE